MEFSCLGRLRPRRVHRHASGAAHSKVGALPALNHKPELSAGRYRPDAIRLYEHRFIVRAHHKLKWARKVQSVLGVLYELLPRSESNKAISTANMKLFFDENGADYPTWRELEREAAKYLK